MAMQQGAARVIFFAQRGALAASALRRAERHDLAIENAAGAGEVRERLKGGGGALLLMHGLPPEAAALVKAARKPKPLRHLPVFAIVPDDAIDENALERANALQIELLPASVPEARRWQRLRDACDLFRAGKYRAIVNRRRHFRLPLQVKASLICAVETVDISLGGVAFMSNHRYKVGDTGKIDIRSLLGDMQEDERGFGYEVVSVKPIKNPTYRSLVGAKFTGVRADVLRRLKDALELVEPTSEENF